MIILLREFRRRLDDGAKIHVLRKTDARASARTLCARATYASARRLQIASVGAAAAVDAVECEKSKE